MAEEPAQNSKARFVRAARRFANVYGKPLVFWNLLYWEYTGTHYKEVGNKYYLRDLIDRWHQDLPEGVTGLDITDYTSEQIEGRLRARVMLLRNQEMPAVIGSEEKSLATVSLANGLLDLEPCFMGREPILRPHSRTWFSTACLPYPYDPKATCPRWEQFLAEALQGDAERINLLQEWYGYCCTFDTSHEKALLMEGPGGNGKSQALEVLRLLVGKGNCSAVGLDRLGNRFDAVATLGKMVNISPETNSGARVPVATLRHLITGEDFQFERKGVDTFMAKPTAKFVISMNKPPAFDDTSNALWRRILLMPWTYSVPKEKIVLDLGRKIAAEELPGIFNWAIEGLKRLRANGRFTESKAVTAATETLRIENDPMKSYLLSRYETTSPDHAIARSLLWNQLMLAKDKCEVEVAPTYTPSKLVADIKRVFPGVAEDRRRLPTASNPVFVWAGLKVKS